MTNPTGSLVMTAKININAATRAWGENDVTTRIRKRLSSMHRYNILVEKTRTDRVAQVGIIHPWNLLDVPRPYRYHPDDYDTCFSPLEPALSSRKEAKKHTAQWHTGHADTEAGGWMWTWTGPWTSSMIATPSCFD